MNVDKRTNSNKGEKKMKPIHIYPGSFCPPTVGHLSILKKACKIAPEVIVICSRNPEKKDCWFPAEKCKELWKTYELPVNSTIMTIDEFTNDDEYRTREKIMIRGIRDESDTENERKVMELNSKKYGIKNYLFIMAEEEHKDVSSTKARAHAMELEIENIGRMVSPVVISHLLEKALELKNIFMVVGKPASGKSTFLKMLAEENENNHHINTDDFSEFLKPIMKKHFGDEDFFELTLKKEDELLKVIRDPWLGFLKDAIKKAPKNSNLFVEVAYGLEDNKKIFRVIGGKVIYIGCDNVNVTTNIERNHGRGTPHLTGFVRKIPGVKETKYISEKHLLDLTCVDTSCSLDELKEKAKIFSKKINPEENK